MNIRFTVNQKELDREIKKSLPSRNSERRVERSLKDKNGEFIYKKIEKMKKQMIQNFLSLPITREIMEGPDASNISGTLGGYGNLFSFIGFSKGDKPIAPIIQQLEKTTHRVIKFSANGRARLTIEMPSKQDIFKVTPLPWATGISWAQRMEIGLSGLGMYLNTSSPSSSSGRGIQVKNPIRGGKFSNQPYVSQFLNKWQKAFLNIDKKVSVSIL